MFSPFDILCQQDVNWFSISSI